MTLVQKHLENLSLQGEHVDWKLHHWVVGLTSHYDYGCNFLDGMCVAARLDPGKIKPEMGCCQSCASFFGYFDYIDSTSADFLLQNYDYELGFWRPGGGCIIPREYRSYRCNKYACPVANLHTGILVRKLYSHYGLNRFEICEHFNWNTQYKKYTQLAAGFFNPSQPCTLGRP